MVTWRAYNWRKKTCRIMRKQYRVGVCIPIIGSMLPGTRVGTFRLLHVKCSGGNASEVPNGCYRRWREEDISWRPMFQTIKLVSKVEAEY